MPSGTFMTVLYAGISCVKVARDVGGKGEKTGLLQKEIPPLGTLTIQPLSFKAACQKTW